MPPLTITVGVVARSLRSSVADGDRQVDADRGAAARRRVERDAAAALVDDAVDRGQAEAGALALRLGGEERLERARPRRRRPCPMPVSVTASITYVPGASVSRSAASRSSSSSTFAVSIVSWPPAGIASRAFSTRLTSTCSIWLESASHARQLGASCVVVSMCSPMTRGSIWSRPETVSLRSRTVGFRNCLRLNASSCASAPPRGRRPCGSRARRRAVRSSAVEPFDDQIGVADDGGQQVVEVVGDAAGEPADRLPSSAPAAAALRDRAARGWRASRAARSGSTRSRWRRPGASRRSRRRLRASAASSSAPLP